MGTALLLTLTGSSNLLLITLLVALLVALVLLVVAPSTSFARDRFRVFIAIVAREDRPLSSSWNVVTSVATRTGSSAGGVVLAVRVVRRGDRSQPRADHEAAVGRGIDIELKAELRIFD